MVFFDTRVNCMQNSPLRGSFSIKFPGVKPHINIDFLLNFVRWVGDKISKHYFRCQSLVKKLRKLALVKPYPTGPVKRVYPNRHSWWKAPYLTRANIGRVTRRFAARALGFQYRSCKVIIKKVHKEMHINLTTIRTNNQTTTKQQPNKNQKKTKKTNKKTNKKKKKQI